MAYGLKASSCDPLMLIMIACVERQGLTSFRDHLTPYDTMIRLQVLRQLVYTKMYDPAFGGG